MELEQLDQLLDWKHDVLLLRNTLKRKLDYLYKKDNDPEYIIDQIKAITQLRFIEKEIAQIECLIEIVTERFELVY